MSETITVNGFNSSEADEIRENIETLLATPKGSIPLDRNYGIDMSCIDEPTIVAQSLLQQEIIEKVEKYEPRVLVKTVDTTINDDGSITNLIEVERNIDYEYPTHEDNSTAEDNLYYDASDYDADEEDE